MRVLQISSCFSRQKLYSFLVSELNKYGLEQYIYVPVRTSKEVGKFQDVQLQNTYYKYAYILKPYHRILYFKKIKKSFSTINEWIDPSSIDLMHAHFLFSDGGIALKLKQAYNIPYIVAVRSTDIDIFFRYLIHLRSFGIKILKEASAIIFINPTSRETLLRKYIPAHLQKELRRKSVCIPNGIDDYWHNHIERPKKLSKTINLLYVGCFVPLKNVPLVIKAASILSKEYNITLTLVGGGGKGAKGTLKAINDSRKLNIYYAGIVKDQSKLRAFYRNADIFIMPSRTETFGLVYIESISQGTPIIYTKGQGVDGFFEEGEVGYGLDCCSEYDIVEKVKLIIENYECISGRCVKSISPFKWDTIASQYQRVYNEVVYKDSVVNHTV